MLVDSLRNSCTVMATGRLKMLRCFNVLDTDMFCYCLLASHPFSGLLYLGQLGLRVPLYARHQAQWLTWLFEHVILRQMSWGLVLPSYSVPFWG